MARRDHAQPATVIVQNSTSTTNMSLYYKYYERLAASRDS